MPSDHGQTPALDPATVLLIDDRPDNLHALEAMLTSQARTVLARSIEEALRQLEKDEFAVLFLAIQMQGIDAFEIARQIRSQEKARPTPIIFLSDHDSSDFPLTEAYKLGAIDYLARPLLPEIVQAKVGGFIELYRQGREVKRQLEQIRLLEHKEMERRLREGEERFRLLVETVRDFAIFLLDRQGHVASWNAGAERLLGYTLEEALGKHYWHFFTPEDLREGRPETELDEALRTGRAEDDNWLLRKDGSRFWANGVTVALRDETGELKGFAKIVRDRTEQKQAEDENARLFEATQRQAEQLAELNRRKDEFIATLGHELRNPLAPLRTCVDLLGGRSGSGPPPAELVDMMHRQLSALSRLVDDLLDLARINRGTVELRKERTDLRAALSRAVEMARPQIDERGHTLSVDLATDSVWVEADPLRLNQVLVNLLSNAARYTPPRGRIEALARTEGEMAVVRVRDTGIGIRRQDLGRIFDVFSHGDRVPGTVQEGLGIGLTLVKVLVEQHGGTVEAASAGPGQGSEFVVRFPALTGAIGEKAPAGSSPILPIARKLRVLVADDNPDTANSFALLLRLSGHEVRAAYDGRAALEAALQFRPEAVLLDIGMPGMDGYEVARHLRQSPDLGRAFLIAVTGYGREEDQQRSLEAGFQAHLVKPVDPTALRALLDQASLP